MLINFHEILRLIINRGDVVVIQKLEGERAKGRDGRFFRTITQHKSGTFIVINLESGSGFNVCASVIKVRNIACMLAVISDLLCSTTLPSWSLRAMSTFAFPSGYVTSGGQIWQPHFFGSQFAWDNF